MRPSDAWLRPRRRTAAALALVLASCGPACAEFVETPFAPPAGSRWIVEDANDIEIVNASSAPETQAIRQKGEIVFGPKSGEGYRAAYTATEMSLDGASPAVKIAGPALEVMKGVTFATVTDARGKPVLVENLDEARKRMGEMVERIASATDNPKVAQAMRNLMTPLVGMSGAEAAQAYAEPLNAMSAAHNIGLKPGEERTETERRPNLFGGDPLIVVMTTRVSQPDPEKRYVLVTRDETYDKESVKAAALTMAKRMMREIGQAPVGVEQQELDRLADAMKLSFDSFSVYIVQGGMTRSIRTRTRIEMSAMGATFSKTDQRVFKITEAP